MIRAGDTVRTKKRMETLLVAYVDGDWLAWYGWPEGEMKLSEVDLIRSCSDAEHRKALEEWADKKYSGDRRHNMASRQLAELNKSYVGAGI